MREDLTGILRRPSGWRAAVVCWLLLARCGTDAAPAGDTGAADLGRRPDSVVETAPRDADGTDAPSDAGAPDGRGADAGPGDAAAADTPAERQRPDAGVPDGAVGDGLHADGAPPDAGAGPLHCEGPLEPRAHEAAADRTFERGPLVQRVLGSAAVIVWRDDVAAGTPGCVAWRAGAGPSREVCAAADAAGQFVVELTALPPGADVTYEAYVGDRRTAPLVFRAAPPDTAPVRLLVFADAHANTETLNTLGGFALQAGVQFAVSNGDAVSTPSAEQWQAFFDGVRALGQRVAIFPVIGNHEGMDASFFDAFVAPEAGPLPHPEVYYDARVGIVWFAALELASVVLPALIGQDGPLVAWLETRLMSPEARGARYRLLFLHQPAYSQGWAPCDAYFGEEILRTTLLPFAAAHGVDAIFSGHMHGYERGEQDGVLLVTSGGAGGALDHACPPQPDLPQPWVGAYAHHMTYIDARCDGLVVEARDLGNQVIDRVERP